jgi:MFS family permease
MDRKWWLVILGCLTHAVNTGFSYFGMSAFFPSFEREFSWSRTAISGAFSLARVESGLLGPIEGYFVDRVGPRRIMYIGIVICTLGFVTLSFVDSLPMLYVAIVLGIVLGSSLGYHMPISLLIAKIFHERRSLAFGIFRMGPGLSGAIVPLVGAMIVWWGWRTAAVASGCMLLAAGLPIAYLINRIAQAEETDRELALATNAGAGSIAQRSLDPQFTLKEVLRLKPFWFLSIAMALRHMVTEGVSVHFVILLVDRGWSTAAASTLLGISALIGAPARVGMGWLGDILDKRKLIMGLLLALSVSVGVMGWAAGSLAFTTFRIIY